MATLTSTQSGNFNSTATWGGNPVPVDADIFIVNYGHIVTIDDDRRVANGFNDSFVRGKLIITSTGKLRMNGILYVDNTASYTTWFTENTNSAGFFRMDPGSLLEIKGTNAEQHRLQIQAHQYVTCEIQGTNPNPNTTLASNANNNDTSLSVVDASNFAAGDWITVYRNDYANKIHQFLKSDEGMWVHDVSGNTIYFRHFVSPSTSIISTVEANVTVSDASVMRVGYKIIFGTGANRNILTITDINYATNLLTLSGVPSGSIIGETVYRTGLEKSHISGDIVLRIAAVVTADSNQGTNTITVNNTNGFSVGDLIMVPVNDPQYSNATSWDNIMDYTISAINTTTKVITLTGGFSSPATTTLQRNVKAGVGGIVVNMNRDTKIKAPEGTLHGADQRSFIYSQSLSNNFTRRMRISNCLINLGNNTNSADYGSIGLRGSFSYQNNTASGIGTSYTSYFDGIVINPVERNNRNCGYWWNHEYLNIRNCVSYNTSSWAFARHGSDHGFFNNIAARYADSIYLEGMYGTTTEVAYNFTTRNPNSGFYISQWYEPSAKFRQNYMLFMLSRPFAEIYQNGNNYIDNCYMDYFVIWPYGERINMTVMNNCYLGNSWDVTNHNGLGVYADSVNLTSGVQGRLDGKSAFSQQFICNGYNFKYGKNISWNRRSLRFYDTNETAWRVYPDRDENVWMGFNNDIYVPANSQVFIRGSVKTASGNTNYPYIYARHYSDGYNNGLYNNNSETIITFDSANVTAGVGFRDISVQFTNSSNVWETRTLTLPKLPFDYYLSIGIGCLNSVNNSRLGWWEKDLDISIENSNGFSEANSVINYLNTRIPVRVRSSLTQLKTILGG